MKKILLLVCVLCINGTWNDMNAKWILGQRISADKIKAGDNIAFEAASAPEQEGKFLKAWPKGDETDLTSATSWGYSMGFNENSVWEVVTSGLNDTENGKKAFYLKMAANNYYLGHAANTLESRQLVSDNAQAHIISFLTPTEAGSVESKKGKLWDENSVVLQSTREGRNGVRLDNWAGQGEPMIYLWNIGNENYDLPWNCWNAYLVTYQKDLQTDLQELVEAYSQLDYQGGTEPGFYEKGYVEAYFSTLEKAMVYSFEQHTDAEYTDMIAKLKQAKIDVESNIVELTEGYYNIVSAWAGFLDQQGEEKAIYAKSDGLYWKGFDKTNPEFVWKVTKVGNNWNIQDFLTENYMTGDPDNWYLGHIGVASEPIYEQILTVQYEGQYSMQNTVNTSCSYSVVNGHDGTSAKEGPISLYGGYYKGKSNLWYFRKITDQKFLDSIEVVKKQFTLTSRLRDLSNEAKNIYDKLIVYNKDASYPIIRTAGKAKEKNQITFTNIRVQGIAGSDDYCFLIDNDTVTYMQGSGSIIVDTKEYSTANITLTYSPRGGEPKQHQWGIEERPTLIDIYATDNLGDENWDYINSVDLTDYVFYPCLEYSFGMGKAYKYIRFDVKKNATNGNFFTLSEFQLYKALPDETKSQYYTIEGMSTAADNMIAAKLIADDIVATNKATEQDITNLQNAIDGVKALYADTTELVALISECDFLAHNINVGNEIGQIPEGDAELISIILGKIDDAKMVLATAADDKKKLDEAVTALRDCKNAIMESMNMFETNKWYYITNVGDETFETRGNVIWANGTSDNVKMKWGFCEDGENLTDPNQSKTMWKFIPIEGSDYYAIQCLYNGFYLGGCEGASAAINLSYTPVPYEVVFAGAEQFYLRPVESNRNKYVLNASTADNNKYITCEKADGKGTTAWIFKEINTDEVECIFNNDFNYNYTDVFCAPYNLNGLCNYNDDVHTYTIKKLVGDAQNGYTGMELIEKEDIAAGEPCIIIIGTPSAENDFEEFEIIIPFPTEITDTPKPANAIVGGLKATDFDEGMGISNGREWYISDNKSTFGAQTGVIDPRWYTGEKEGETSLTIPFTGKLTGIKNAIKSQKSKTKNTIGINGVIYNKDINSLEPGFYVIDGSKVAK